MVCPDPYLPGHGDTRHRVHHYDLRLAYKVTTNRLNEDATVDLEIVEATRRIDLDLYALQAAKVTVDGHTAKYRQRGGRISIDVGDRKPGDRLVVQMQVSGKPRPMPGQHGSAGWEELTDGSMVGSQPQGAPSWFPCNNDAADKATYRIEVTTESGYDVVANGTLLEQAPAGRNTRWVYVMDRPMAPYLATIQIGRYVTDTRRAGVPVEVIHPRGAAAGRGTAFERQGEMVDFFTDVFGPYPFNEYRAVIVDDDLEIPLEAQGLSSFGRNFLPADWANERLVAHELAHQWFGNSVTARRLQDIWLHEGFACYAEWLWAEHRRRWFRGQTAQQLAARHHAGLPEDLGDRTLADPGMRSMFDDWVYKRGALTLHAVRVEVGDDAFFDMLRAWTRTHAYGLVDTDMFIEHCCTAVPERAERLRGVFDAWLFQPELPDLPGKG